MTNSSARASSPPSSADLIARLKRLAHWEVEDDLQALRTRLACIGVALRDAAPVSTEGIARKKETMDIPLGHLASCTAVQAGWHPITRQWNAPCSCGAQPPLSAVPADATRERDARDCWDDDGIHNFRDGEDVCICGMATLKSGAEAHRDARLPALQNDFTDMQARVAAIVREWRAEAAELKTKATTSERQRLANIAVAVSLESSADQLAALQLEETNGK